MNKKITFSTTLNICLTIFFFICVIAPILNMLSRITPEGFQAVLDSPQFKPALCNTIATGFTATVISLILSLTAALCIERTNIRFKEVLRILFVLPMLIPSISHAIGLITLYGSNGLFTNLLYLNTNIYGFFGIVTGSVMYSFPVSFLMFSGILKYENAMPYKAAEILGIPPLHRYLALAFPYLKKTMISAFFAVFTMIVTDYGVPLIIGGKTITLSVLMYNKAVGMIDYSAGCVIGVFLLIPAIAAFFIDMFISDSEHTSYITEAVTPKPHFFRNACAYTFCGAMSIFIISPIVAFCTMVFQTKYPVNSAFTLYHIEKTMHRSAGEYLANSIFYSLLAALLGTLLAFTCAYLTTRTQSKLNKLIHLLSTLSMSIPGMVLGLSYVIFFHDSSIYGTFIIIVLANSIHFFASPYLMMHNTLKKLNPDLNAVGQTLGIHPMHIIKDVILPKTKYTLFEMFSYFFVNSMMTISAVSFLAPPAPKPVALMINQFEAQLLMESAAFVSLLILFINLTIKIVFTTIQRKSFS